MPTATAVADALRPFDDTMDPQRLAEQASSSKQPMGLITLRQSDHDRVAAAIGALPGVVITPQAELLPTDDAFAPDIISQVKKAVIDELDGQAGWRVVSVNQNGVDVDVLNEVPGAPAPSVTISLDRSVQNAAQDAVNMAGNQAMIVVIKPSTGEILAVAQNAAADADGPARHHGPLSAGVDVQDRHRRRGHRTRHGHAQYAARLPGHDGHRAPHSPQLRRVRPRHRADVAGVRQFVQHHFRRAGQQDAAAGADAGRRAVRHRARLPDRGHHHGVRFGAADGEPRRTHRGRFRPGQGGGQPVRDGAGRGDRRGRENACAATDRGPARPIVTGDRTPITPKMLDGLRPMMRLVVTNGTADDLLPVGRRARQDR